MNSLQKALLCIAAGLAVLVALIVVTSLDQIDPNGAMNILVGAIGGCIAAVVTVNRKGKGDE